MILVYLVGSIVAAALLIYLIIALLKPEAFS
jgi:K+-transporting ATPase KdpF subunit